ncbi:ABC transporter ATP-binding protein [Rhodospirillum rubrum]|uniref:ABC transporter component n=1 Tax=Rhodospirillum rubrum (strain ATCC 11170 / ATH 1.1.1 / DSM 467 / LMG 4362 / NCIMB 8255 / S1) TaxID=269796 RepID=Q2RP45_RHORT|nr:ABC transporter ATP-binding protein [Rhodospirillum rubrum]ABC24100.1 ABC transporter component [Rhodospirillum rubrum ATCC 11170]AEO49846.1 ABC transporter protein [Rhodospirillum rubrum F11]MBK5955785.1 ABC transporter ATP-binding protein [Rhodospirillum rubrum]QXG80042.1 ABC transporter ATP-binding protein [Rhodospirillum rubrum]HAP99711.1 ABC transporter ATP-binding protein [Rhodospirillum rubrum]
MANPSASAPTLPLLAVADLHGWYGESHVLHGMAFEVPRGEIVTLLGRNGAGKSTTLKAIMGALPQRKGSIRIDGRETIGLAAHKVPRLGVAWCPEERGIFSSLSVAENLTLPPVIKPGGLSLAEVEALFPRLVERRASQGTKLSGGEQQMLAIARILRTGAEVLLLDEPTEGLAPVIVSQIADIVLALKTRGFTVLLVEQNFSFASRVADRHYVVEHGRVIDTLLRDEVTPRRAKLKEYLGV